MPPSSGDDDRDGESEGERFGRRPADGDRQKVRLPPAHGDSLDMAPVPMPEIRTGVIVGSAWWARGTHRSGEEVVRS